MLVAATQARHLASCASQAAAQADAEPEQQAAAETGEPEAAAAVPEEEPADEVTPEAELRTLMAQLESEGCREQNTLDTLCAYVRKYPDVDIEDAVDTLPEEMRELLRSGLARASSGAALPARTVSETEEEAVAQEATELTRQGTDSLQQRLAALQEAPAEAAARSPLASRPVNAEPAQSTTTSRLDCLRARLSKAAEEDEAAATETAEVAQKEEAAPAAGNLSEIRERLARLQQRA